LNRDGTVNSADVEIGKAQALGTSACSTADLTGDGICNVIDVQRIINATSGGTCKTGQ